MIWKYCKIILHGLIRMAMIWYLHGWLSGCTLFDPVKVFTSVWISSYKYCIPSTIIYVNSWCEHWVLHWWGRYYQVLCNPMRCWDISSEVSETESVSLWLAWGSAEHKLGPICFSALLLEMLTLLCWLVIALLYYSLWQTNRVIRVRFFYNHIGAVI